jgi:hypothetical protein
MTIRANLFELLRTPVRVSRVTLDGMVIKVAPKRDQQDKEASTKPKYHTHLANFEIDHVEAGGTLLYILRKNPQAEPMLFELRKLALNSAGVGQPMAFTAELTNPTPPGLIQTKGHFGPWNFDDPAATPVDGDYDFQHADLSVFAGISGILSSQGKYTGALNNIVVDGKTDVPNFQLDSGGQEVHLTTKFHAIVDGTNGNTYLQPVNAHFLNSNVTTNGEVAGKPGQKGKTITLAVDISKAYVQDVLALAAKGTPMLTGGIVLFIECEVHAGENEKRHGRPEPPWTRQAWRHQHRGRGIGFSRRLRPAPQHHHVYSAAVCDAGSGGADERFVRADQRQPQLCGRCAPAGDGLGGHHRSETRFPEAPRCIVQEKRRGNVFAG